METKIKLTVDFEADDVQNLLAAVDAFAHEVRQRGLPMGNAISTAGWQYRSRSATQTTCSES